MSADRTDHHPRRRVPLWLALVVVAVGLVLLAVGIASQVQPPQPPRAVGRIDPPSASPSTASAGATASASPSAAPAPLPPSPPVRVVIPSIGVDSAVRPIGLAPDGTLAVPQPGPYEDTAAWFSKSPTPGQPGPSVLEGHVDTTRGPSVFFKLGAVRPGAKIIVHRADRVVVTFTVDAVRDYPKSAFPTTTVYGAKNLSRPTLRVITCSDFDTATRHHTGNEVVFAHLTATRRAG
ncbi:hypothetical protein GCM10027596_41360 [Nocardioides korecus]